MPNICCYSITATGPKDSLQRLHDLLWTLLVKGDWAYGPYILDVPKLVDQAFQQNYEQALRDQIVGVSRLCLQDDGTLHMRGESGYCPPIVTEYLAKRFPDLEFQETGDTEYGDVVERWQINSNGRRCLDMGKYYKDEEKYHIHDGIDLETGQPTKFTPWGERPECEPGEGVDDLVC
jgi:hypothetical protein